MAPKHPADSEAVEQPACGAVEDAVVRLPCPPRPVRHGDFDNFRAEHSGENREKAVHSAKLERQPAGELRRENARRAAGVASRIVEECWS